MKLQLKRSSALVNGDAKPPLATQLDFGEVAVNFNAADPKIFIKNSNNIVVGFTDHLLPLAGGTLTGDLTLSGDPTSALMPATKQYTDNAVAGVQNSITYPVTSVNALTGAVTLDYVSVGAPSTSGANAVGNNWNIGILGNSATATALATSRSFTLSGDVTGSASFDGTADVSITATVADDSHNHVISNIDGLSSSLNGKLGTSDTAANSNQLGGLGSSSFVQTANNSSLNSDNRNTRGVTRLYRRDGNSDYSVQTEWTGSYWRLRGYNGDTFHGNCQVSYADSAGNADTVDSLHASSFIRSDADDTATGTVTFNGTVNFRSAVDLADSDILRFGSSDDVEMFFDGSNFYMDLNSGGNNFYIRDGTTTRFTFDDAGHFTATGNVTAYSDVRLKENIEPITDALAKIESINGVTFDKIDEKDGPRYTGVIAQDVESVLPEAVTNHEDGFKSVAYGNMIGLLVEAIKELKAEITAMKSGGY